ncbi:SDR family oxidoreductase [Neptuniibacter halophilus]|uniref:SDR family oxidoreductase n=1 Tax=Neptuniibacter halophilus TaxID=651666 RepID=UPI0025724B1F|nr:SDR family oxidoreductase [Neptuniibacter halophilus]
MQQKTILIAGCGDVGSKLGQQLLQQGHNVVGLRRNINQLPQGIQGISADLGQLDTLQQALSEIQQCDILVYSAAASSHDEAGYQSAYLQGMRNLLQALPVQPQHLFFTSSSGVYHQDDHGWVDETSPCHPQSFSGRIMLQAEQAVAQASVPSTVVRFTGIYGPGRNHLLNRVRRGDVAPQEPPQYSNRIHRDDCTGVLNHLINLHFNGQALLDCYLATDDEPVTMHEVTHWLAETLGSEILTTTASRRAGSKRCSNQRLKDSGYKFIYPDFRSGYRELIHSQ